MGAVMLSGIERFYQIDDLLINTFTFMPIESLVKCLLLDKRSRLIAYHALYKKQAPQFWRPAVYEASKNAGLKLPLLQVLQQPLPKQNPEASDQTRALTEIGTALRNFDLSETNPKHKKYIFERDILLYWIDRNADEESLKIATQLTLSWLRIVMHPRATGSSHYHCRMAFQSLNLLRTLPVPTNQVAAKSIERLEMAQAFLIEIFAPRIPNLEKAIREVAGIYSLERLFRRFLLNEMFPEANAPYDLTLPVPALPDDELMQATSKICAFVNDQFLGDFASTLPVGAIPFFMTCNARPIAKYSNFLAGTLPNNFALFRALLKEVYALNLDLLTQNVPTPSPEFYHVVTQKLNFMDFPLEDAITFEPSPAINEFDTFGVTPFIRAIEKPTSAATLPNKVQFLKSLLDAGANPNAQRTCNPDSRSELLKGRTALHYVTAKAPLYARPTLMTLLLQHGANPNLQDSAGRTPAHLALLNERPDVISVNFLLANGADIFVEAHGRQSVLALAIEKKVAHNIKWVDADGTTVTADKMGLEVQSLAEHATGYYEGFHGINAVFKPKTMPEICSHVMNRTFDADPKKDLLWHKILLSSVLRQWSIDEPAGFKTIDNKGELTAVFLGAMQKSLVARIEAITKREEAARAVREEATKALHNRLQANMPPKKGEKRKRPIEEASDQEYETFVPNSRAKITQLPEDENAFKSEALPALWVDEFDHDLQAALLDPFVTARFSSETPEAPLPPESSRQVEVRARQKFSTN